MPDFEYRVIGDKGRVVKGVGAAESVEVLIEGLRASGYGILDVRPVRAADGSRPVAKRRFSFELFGIPERALVFFTRQFATTLTVGLPLLRALTTLQQQSSSPRLRYVLTGVINGIQQGQSLTEAMSAHRDAFSELFLSMIRIGEASGNLEATVTRLADMSEKDFAIRRKVKGALTYPLFVLAFSAILVYGMMAFLLPGFFPIFESSGLDIKRDYPITQCLLEASRLATNGYVVGGILGAIVTFFVVLRLASRTVRGRYAIDTFKFYFPGLKGLIHTATLTRLCRTFGMLTGSGVPLLETLELVAECSGNEVVSRSIQRVSRDIQSGERISSTLARIPFFPPLLVQMITVGEETGTLDAMFFRAADYYEQELEASLTSLTALIEPAMMVFVGGVVCFFVLGVLSPLLGISAAFQQQI